jgi:hypothetical protein
MMNINVILEFELWFQNLIVIPDFDWDSRICISLHLFVYASDLQALYKNCQEITLEAFQEMPAFEITGI